MKSPAKSKTDPDRDASIYHRLREDILFCRIPPGAQIFEQDLANRFGISKSPVREALLRLRQQGLVEVKARSGYRVTPVSVTKVNDMYEMRVMYETTCAALAIAHASDEDLDRLDEFRSAPECSDVSEWTALNRNFHITLASICGNDQLARTAIEFVTQFARFTYLSSSKMRRFRVDNFVDDHVAIIAALRDRDRRRAQSVLKAHIEASRRRILHALASPPIVP